MLLEGMDTSGSDLSDLLDDGDSFDPVEVLILLDEMGILTEAGVHNGGTQ